MHCSSPFKRNLTRFCSHVVTIGIVVIIIFVVNNIVVIIVIIIIVVVIVVVIIIIFVIIMKVLILVTKTLATRPGLELPTDPHRKSVIMNFISLAVL